MPPDTGHGLDDAANVISTRDALERAAALDNPDEAKALLNQATAAGDTVLATAINTRARAEGWTSVANYRDVPHDEYVKACAAIGFYRTRTR